MAIRFETYRIGFLKVINEDKPYPLNGDGFIKTRWLLSIYSESLGSFAIVYDVSRLKDDGIRTSIKGTFRNLGEAIESIKRGVIDGGFLNPYQHPPELWETLRLPENQRCLDCHIAA